MSGTSHAVRVLVAASALLGTAAKLALSAQQAPALRASVDLVTIDVQVTPARDSPLRQLAAADFDITISGQKRPAASATHSDVVG